MYVYMEGTSKEVESDDESSALVSSGYVSIRHASAHVSTRQHTSAYVEESDDECSALVSSSTRLIGP